jgi:NAD(P)-dependent dehydrogenase (short-subunit alcohol dehydrogenase family)
MKRLEIDFEGRTVLITGAATGVGRATALAFAAARAAVVIGDVDRTDMPTLLVASPSKVPQRRRLQRNADAGFTN